MEAFPQLGMEAYHGEDIYVFRPNWITDLHMKKGGHRLHRLSHSGDAYALDQAILQQDHGVLKEVQSWASGPLPPPV